jgi:hypothetical protein
MVLERFSWGRFLNLLKRWQFYLQIIIKLVQFLFINSLNIPFLLKKFGGIINGSSINNIVARRAHSLKMMASDKFPCLCSVINLFLREASEIRFVLEGDGIDGDAVVVSGVADKALLMGGQDLCVFFNHAT